MSRTYRRSWVSSKTDDFELKLQSGCRDHGCGRCWRCKPHRFRGVGKLHRMKPSDQRRYAGSTSA